MGGVSTMVINTAKSPTVSQEIDASPGSVGIEKMLRCVGSEYPAKNSPKIGKPKIRGRRMPKQVMEYMGMILERRVSMRILR